MACSIKFVRLDDFIADIDSLDLSANGYSLADDGYFQAVAPIGATAVHEVITLKLQGTSKDDLAAMTQEIDEKVKQVQWWLENPGVEKYQVWIRVQLDGETNPRQAQLLDIQPPMSVRTFTPEERNKNYIGDYSIGITRTPYWEDPYSYPTQITLDDVDGNAETGTSFGTAVPGDVNARVARIQVKAAKPLSGFWLGFKSDRFGNPANFVPYWAFADGTPSGADTTIISGPSSQSILKCDFSVVATMGTRVSFTVNDIAPAHPEDQRGEYTVLMRAKVDTGTEVRTRLRYSLGPYAFPASSVYRDRVPIVIDHYYYYEMGGMQIPPQQTITLDSVKNFYAALDVERTSGSGAFYAFGFHLIPTEAWLKIKSPDPSPYPLTGYNAIYQRADMSLSAYDYATSLSYVPQNHLVVTGPRWNIPTGTNYIVCVADDQNFEFSGYADAVDFLIDYIPRWRTLRGNA